MGVAIATLVAAHVGRGEVYRSTGDENLFNYAFNKSNIDASAFNFKSYPKREWTHVERSCLSHEALVEAVSDAAERLCKDTYFHCFDSTVWLRHSGDANERVHLNVRHRALGDRDYRGIVFKLDGGRRPASCFDRDRVAVHLIDRAAHPRRCGVVRQAGSCAKHTGRQCSTDPNDLRLPPHHNLTPLG